MTEWRWGCIECGSNGRADSAVHAAALGRNHETYACPAFALAYDEAVGGYLQRVGRHNLLANAYPGDETPRWGKEQHAATRWRNQRLP